MSTTFEVIPVKTRDVTFRQVLELSERRINLFLNSIEIDYSVKLSVNLHENSEKYVKDVDLDTEFNWKSNEYVWFTIMDIPGGTDAYCTSIKDDRYESDPWWYFEEIISNNTSILNLEHKIEKAKDHNLHWKFRRSAGQLAITNLAYGLISASVAELTGGLIWTDDGAWNFKNFPAEPNEFYTWYFKPEIEYDPKYKEWAKKCLLEIEEEIRAVNNDPKSLTDQWSTDHLQPKKSLWSRLKSLW